MDEDFRCHCVAGFGGLRAWESKSGKEAKTKDVKVWRNIVVLEGSAFMGRKSLDANKAFVLILTVYFHPNLFVYPN